MKKVEHIHAYLDMPHFLLLSSKFNAVNFGIFRISTSVFSFFSHIFLILHHGALFYLMHMIYCL